MNMWIQYDLHQPVVTFACIHVNINRFSAMELAYGIDIYMELNI